MNSISCCGIPELLMSFFLRAKLTNFPPVQYVIFKVQVWIDRRLCSGWHGSFRSGTENADTCQAEAFYVSAFGLFFCAIIITEAALAVKQTGTPSAVDK